MSFDTSKRDSQATDIVPLSPDKFDLDVFADYEKSLLEKSGAFWNAASGVAVYRRVRAAEVFADGSRDMKHSLELQLGCLQKSMSFKADIPNFLEPWYGIGTCAAAYGIEYAWNEGQAPVVIHRFDTAAAALQYTPIPIAQTAIGKHTLNMIDYFMNQTKGKLPVSFTDAQSPLNTSMMVVENTNLLMDLLIDTESVQRFFDILSGLNIDFVNEQKKIIGDCLANPGHGFASARNFSGYGQSDDYMLMLSNDQYIDYALSSFVKTAQPFGGPVFHSCGNWSGKIPVILKMKNIRMADGAFSLETDPNPNPATPFSEGLANSDIILNARVVGNVDVIEQTVRQLWSPGMKLIVVTYCTTPEEQARAYDIIHEICN
jgi:hypothetical protein